MFTDVLEDGLWLHAAPLENSAENGVGSMGFSEEEEYSQSCVLGRAPGSQGQQNRNRELEGWALQVLQPKASWVLAWGDGRCPGL